MFRMSLLLLSFSLQASDICVVTMAIGDQYQNIVRPALENKWAYCQKQGYPFFGIGENLDPERPIPWSKIRFMQHLFNLSDWKWLFWSDADSLIMNDSIRLESFLDEDYDIIITRDFNTINTGQFFVKRSAWSQCFLEKVYNHPEYIHDCIWENRAFVYEYEHTPDVEKHIKVVSQRLFNSYPKEMIQREDATYREGDFILHFAGIHHPNVLNYMIFNYLKLAVPANRAR